MSRTARTLAALAAATALLACACASDGDPDPATATATDASAAQLDTATDATEAPLDTSATEAPATARGALTTADTAFGAALALADGQVLYVFLEDAEGVGSCTGDCAAKWPPVAAGDVSGAEGVELGAVTRGDGVVQLTVDGRPAYTFSGDLPGEATCQGGDGVWWILRPDGTVNDTPA